MQTYQKEKDFCLGLEDKYGDFSWQLQQENKRWLVSAALMHQRQPELLEDIERDFKNAEQFGLQEAVPALSALQKSSNLETVAYKLFRACSEHVLEKTNGMLEGFEGNLKQIDSYPTSQMQNPALAPYLGDLSKQKALELKDWTIREELRSKELAMNKLEEQLTIKEPDLQQVQKQQQLQEQEQIVKEQRQILDRGLDLDR